VFGLSGEKLLILGIIAVFVLGPDRLPYYAQQLAKLVKSLRRMADGAKDQLSNELGEGFEDLDWKKLDPRQYDPRRIIREALTEDLDSAAKPATLANRPKPATLAAGEAAPYDSEAT
jgi:sec-independent protein translocase protein TatB